MNVTIQDLIAEAMRLSTRLEALTDETYRAAKRLADASTAFEQAEAKAWATVRHEMGTRDDAGEKHLSRDYEAEVVLRVAEEARRLATEKATDKALDNASRNLRQQLSAIQSVAAAVRDEVRLAGVVGP